MITENERLHQRVMLPHNNVESAMYHKTSLTNNEYMLFKVRNLNFRRLLWESICKKCVLLGTYRQTLCGTSVNIIYLHRKRRPVFFLTPYIRTFELPVQGQLCIYSQCKQRR